MIRNKYKVLVWRSGGVQKLLNGKTHYTSGPAVECLDGYKAWYKHGIFERSE